ncbi:bifunctional farnesyl-diphosphate farnesyltransferase/squalene synthase NDAI_0K00290 [Naumovozyma dairenensis CBS 421]|uniref:Squalene synthase n=1 Tax=Naumovozyma dairenensis (strain ATCC 10597 / BCRC 20456 / CBS 421 / NBRC 0211 / NRRL Y-12639) TaxID=1071378 RepID=G0WHF7_NAUDC|nr:hypothetical protein NDAI_0K00290 [Naumovozyma dairenensis CBS 421]CCD27218.1 hypothetical protein NDAI_0K00290 [Naumovozyma dairenensis CBS 421]
MGKAIDFLIHPLELKAAFQLKYIRNPLFYIDSTASPNEKECYKLLNLTSRSFAAVIMELHPELRNVIMVFYLILRALDTMEDDMSIDTKLKVELLRDFHEKLDLKEWSFNGNSPDEKDRAVLVKFDCILHEFHKLSKKYRDVIQDITKQMGNGMADYILDENFNLNGVETIADYDKYCHYVAGLVGDGLTRLIILAQFAPMSLYDLEKDKELPSYESMGLFLQKTNIIRDYAEDLHDGRSFWPQEIWSLYADKLTDFQQTGNEQKGLECINHLVYNALSHVDAVLNYLSSIHEQSTFQFCAIPQVMAIATLAKVFNNPTVLHKNVKIRKGTTCYLILKSRTLKGCVEIFEYYLRDIRKRLPVEDPNYLKINIEVARIDQLIEEMYPDNNLPPNVKPRETELYLKVKERTKFDKEVIPIQQDEDLRINVYLTFIFAITFSILIQFL